MIRTGGEYRESIRDGREVWIDGERVEDVTTHPAFKPIVDVRARIYDMAHEAETRDVMTYVDPGSGERCAVGPKLPMSKDDWSAKRRAVDAVLDDIGGVVTRVGDETVGEMWALFDGQDVLAEIDPRFSEHIRDHVQRAAVLDPFHVSANTDPKGDRSRRPQDQDPDVLLHVVRETDDGIVVRGAKFETAAAYANQAFVKPTIGDWGQDELSDYAVGFIVRMGAPGIKHICRSGFAGTKPVEDYPLTNRFDEVDTLIVFDDVEIPWEDVLFYRHTRAASFIRATLHRYSQFAFVQRHLRYADLLVGAAYASVSQTGVKMHQGVREKLAELVCYREGINAHLTAAVEHAEPSPAGLADAQPGAALHGPRARRHGTRRRGADRARPLRGTDVRHPVGRDVPRPRGRAMAGEVLPDRGHRRRGAAQAPRLRARPHGLRLRGPPADVPALRPVAAVRASPRRLQQLRLLRPARAGPQGGGPVRGRRARADGGRPGGRPRMTHRRIRPFNTRDTYPEQGLDNDLCQAVVAGNLVFIRGQVGQDLDTAESVGHGDAAAQAERAMANIGLLLAEAGARLEDICRVTIYLTDIRYREERLPGDRPPSQGRVPGLDRGRRVRARAARVAGRGRGDRGDPRRPGGGRVTFSLLGVDAEAGRVGCVISSSSPAVAARCVAVRAGVGAAASQNITDPRLGPRLLDLLAAGRSPQEAIDEVVASEPDVEYRQLAVVDLQGRTAAFSGAQTLGEHASAQGSGAVAAGNLLAGHGRAGGDGRGLRGERGERARRPARRGAPCRARGGGRGGAGALGRAAARRRRAPGRSPTSGSTGPTIRSPELAALWQLWKPQTGRLRAAGARAGGGPELRRSGRPVAGAANSA